MPKKLTKKKTEDPLASVPPETREEIERHFEDLTEQLEVQRAEAKEWQALKPYLDQAKAAGKTLEEVLQEFSATEHYLREQPVDVMFTLCEQLGIDAHEMSRALIQMGEGSPPEAAPLDLEKLMPAIDARLDSVRREQDALLAIETFEQEHPRYSELEPVMAGLLEKHIAKDLPDAYAKAALLIPALPKPGTPANNHAAQTRAPMPAVQPALNTPDPAQTRKAKLSITGAPASGSNPATRKVPATTRDAVEKAFAQLGL